MASLFKTTANSIGEVIGTTVQAAGKLVSFLARQALGLTSLVGAGIAWCNTISFTGWAGVGKSLLVGLGTSVGGTVFGIGGLIVGGIAGVVSGSALGGIIGRSKKGLLVGAMAGGAIGSIGGMIAGDIQGMVSGYKYTKHKVLEKSAAAAKTSFNANSQKNSTVVLDAKTMAKYAPKKKEAALAR